MCYFRDMRVRFLALAALAVVVPVASAFAQVVRAASTHAHWQFGVVRVALKADLQDGCVKLGWPSMKGVINRTLQVDVAVTRDDSQQCRGVKGPVTRDYNYSFPGITQAADAVSLRFVSNGQEIGRETVEISTLPPPPPETPPQR
jgi:hypothetical protein